MTLNGREKQSFQVVKMSSLTFDFSGQSQPSLMMPHGLGFGIARMSLLAVRIIPFRHEPSPPPPTLRIHTTASKSTRLTVFPPDPNLGQPILTVLLTDTNRCTPGPEGDGRANIVTPLDAWWQRVGCDATGLSVHKARAAAD